MNMTEDFVRNPISTRALSIALILCSGIWQLSVYGYYSTSGLGADWSATPLSWMLAVVAAPAVCFAGGMLMVGARRRSQFTVVEWWAMMAIFLPVTVGSLLSAWAVAGLFRMSGL